MAHEEIKKYIKKNVSAGHHPETVKKTLVEHGHPEHHVDEAMKEVSGEESHEETEGGEKMDVEMKNPHYGGFWIRLVAAILDGFIIGIPVSLISFGLLLVTGMTSLGYIIDLAAIVFIVYMVGKKGGTPGKLILGLRIVNEQGGYIGIPGAILRYIGKILSGIIFGIGFLMIGFTEKKQGLHDYIAKTVVVYKK